MSRPFTLIVCRAGCDGPAGASVMEPLRDAVRTTFHGILVATACHHDVLRCDAFGPYGSGARGLFAVAQPCTTDRRPCGLPTRLGPITGPDDAAAVAAWLRAGLPDDGTLPKRLRAAPPPRAVARLN